MVGVFLYSGFFSHCHLLSSECPLHATENSTIFHANLCTSLNSFNRYHKGQEMRRDQSKIRWWQDISVFPFPGSSEDWDYGSRCLTSLPCNPHQLWAGVQSMTGRSMCARVCEIKWTSMETSFQRRPACYSLGFCFFKSPCIFFASSNLTREVTLHVVFIPGWHMFFHFLCFVFFQSTTLGSIIPTRCGGL